jgi:GDP-4-dehydro-6-deoxy-D-mannose reductase
VPPTPYGLSKLAQDRLAARMAAEDGLDVVIARPFNHAGPRQSKSCAVASFARQIARIEAGLTSPEIRVGNLDARRDITDVRDVVEAYELLMAGAPDARPYNICSGRAWRIGDLLEELTHLSSVPVSVVVDQDKFRPNDMPVLQAMPRGCEPSWADAEDSCRTDAGRHARLGRDEIRQGRDG